MCQGLMTCPSTPVASFDEQGLIFGVATDSGVVKLYGERLGSNHDSPSSPHKPLNDFQMSETMTR